MTEKCKIFIGASAKTSDLFEEDVRRLINTLRQKGFDPIHWRHGIPAGSETLEGLRQQARQCDGAVFFFAADDFVMQGGKTLYKARDNVVFEFGLFMGHLDPARTVMLAQEGSTKPTDLNSFTHFNLDQGLLEVNRVSNHLEKVVAEIRTSEHRSRETEQGGYVPIYFANSVSNALLDGGWPADWHQRLAYIGIDSARAWMKIEASKGIDLKSDITKNLSVTAGASALISFGPGDGSLDRYLIADIKNRLGRPVWYVPIDINSFFVNRAIKQTKIDNVHVPFGIVTDFEGDLSYIKNLLSRLPSNGPRIFSLLGFTLSNLDMGEDPFITQVSDLMTRDDYLVLDATTKGPQWTPDGDIAGDPNAHPEGWPEFFSIGLSRKTGEPLQVVQGKRLLKNYKTRIKCPIERATPLEGATSFIVRDSRSRKHIYKFTRYDFESLRRWLVQDQHFTIISPDEARPRNDESNTEVWVLVCKKNK